MKRFLLFLLALAMLCSFIACDSQDSVSDDEDNKGASAAPNGSTERFGLYLKNETLAKLDSLGKCEENKKIVDQYVVDYYYVAIGVYTWSDPDAAYDTYEQYYFFNSESGFDNEVSNAEEDGEHIAEMNRDELWIKYESTGSEDLGNVNVEMKNLTYSDIYSYFKAHSSLFTLVE